jgi:hypothetical protein
VVIAEAGGKKYVRVADPGGSYLASSDPRAHFGLPASVTAVDRFVVRWPDGGDEEFPGGAVDRRVTLEKGKGRARP